jgi:hypothetical protein
MKLRASFISFSGILLFLIGVLMAFAISAGVVWGEVETRLYTSQSGSFDLAIKCPLMLSFDETGTISASINNSLDETVKPMLTADFSHVGGPQELSEVLILTPHESRTVIWNVDASNIIFGRLILVSILQRTYRDLPSRQGYCGIMILNILGMNGRQILTLLCSVSLLLLIIGGVIWLRNHFPMDEQDKTVARAFGSLAVLATVGLLAALLRRWGLTIILDGITLMLIGVIFTEVLFKPGQRRR